MHWSAVLPDLHVEMLEPAFPPVTGSSPNHTVQKDVGHLIETLYNGVTGQLSVEVGGSSLYS